ncbi:MAG: hypothetical protein ACE5D0_06765 [Fidelibacterota bacterium]
MKQILYLLGVLMIVISCDNYSDESYTISDIDGKACQVFSADTVFKTVTSYTLDDSLDSVDEQIDSLIAWDSEIFFNPDTLQKISKSEDTTYSVLQITTSGDYVIYTNKFVKMSLWDTSDNLSDVTNLSIDLETVAECNDEIALRNEYSFTSGSYLVQFLMEEASGFNLVIRNKE